VTQPNIDLLFLTTGITMKRLLLSLFIITIFMATARTAFADVTMELSDGGLAQVSDGHVAFGTKETYVLIEPGQNNFILVNNDDQSFIEVPPDFTQRMADTMAATMKKMMAELPPEQRAIFKMTMKGMPGMQQPVEKTARRTGNQNTVAGFDCSEVEISASGRGVEELICVATADQLGISAADHAALVGAMSAMAKMGNVGNYGIGIMNFDDIGGMPIRTQNSELVGINSDSIPADRFEIPTGYREISIDTLLRQ
jgi:hypothetical protein